MSSRRLRWSLLVSGCIHVAVICLFPAARVKLRVMEFPPLYEVSLVNIQPERRPPPPKPVKKPPVRPKKEPPKVATPKVEPPKKKPEEKPKVEPPKPVEKKKEEPEPAKPPPPAPKVATKPRVEVDIPSWYCDTIEQIVNRHWDAPIVGAEVLLETVIYFDILRSGEVVSARIEKESGDRRWDLAGLRAVMESRFPPLPSEYKREKLEFAVGFISAGATAAQ